MVPLMQPSAHGQYFLALYDTFWKVDKILYAGKSNPTLKKGRTFSFKNISEKNFDILSNSVITLTFFTAIASSMGQFLIVDISSTTFKFTMRGLSISTRWITASFQYNYLYWKMAWIRKKTFLSRILRILRQISSFLY